MSASRLWNIPARACLVAAVFAGILATGIVHDPPTAEGQEAPWPREMPGPGADGVDFVSDAVCAGCHQAQSEAWRTSHHFHAMAEASDATVLADFNDAVFAHESGRVTRFFRRDGGFFVNTQGPDGAVADFEVLYTFGVEGGRGLFRPFDAIVAGKT